MEAKDVDDEQCNNEHEVSARRKALFSVAEREAECKVLLGQVNGQKVETLLQDLESFTGPHEDVHNTTLSSGPFSVFTTSVSASSIESHNEIPSDQEDQPISNTIEDDIDEVIRQSHWDEVIDVAPNRHVVDLDFFDTRSRTPVFNDSFDTLFEFPASLSIEEDIQDVDLYKDLLNSSPTEYLQRTPSPRELAMPLEIAGDFGDLAPLITNTLLVHYKEAMLQCFVPLKQEKSPWSIVHLPCAMSAYGEMALLGDTNNAKAALFFAICAMSALNLEQIQRQETGTTSQWQTAGERYRSKAKSRLQASLREQGGSVKKAKYKEVLMALLSMVTICVVSGQMEDTKSFLLDAERFIYLHGLSKRRKSKKVLMLHAIFLYLRVVQESTCISDAALQASLPNATYHELSADGSFSCRYPSLWTDRLKLSLSLDTDNLEMQLMSYPSDAAEPTIFEHVYGIPEYLFRYISHATYLANELERHHSKVANHRLDASIKALESRICSYQNPYKAMAVIGPRRSPDEFESRCSLYYDFIEAIHSALMIYYYRRVRDVNSLVLQHYVKKTIHHLLVHERKKIEQNDASANFCWPGFVAACEALDAKDRETVSKWLERSYTKSGLGSFNTARDVAEKVWAARGRSGNADMSWHDVLARGKTALILS
ncbi:hypothetical protein AAFC00_001875 [Neodothiora populina]